MKIEEINRYKVFQVLGHVVLSPVYLSLIALVLFLAIAFSPVLIPTWLWINLNEPEDRDGLGIYLFGPGPPRRVAGGVHRAGAKAAEHRRNLRLS
jgi:hypothetical protein